MCDSFKQRKEKQERDIVSLVSTQNLCVMMSESEERGTPCTEGKPELTSGNMSSTTHQVQSGLSVSPSVSSVQPSTISATEDEDESEDESYILEESPCGRWQKRKEEVRVDH